MADLDAGPVDGAPDSSDTAPNSASAATDAGDAESAAPFSGALVLPVEETSTLRATVAHAVETAIDRRFSVIHLVAIASWRNDDPGTDERIAAAERILDRAAAWAESDLADADVGGITVAFDTIGGDEYLFGPNDYVRVLTAYAEANDAETVLLDPEYTPLGNTTLLQPLEFALSNTSLTVETAPVSRPTRRERLRTEATGIRFAALFGVSLLFYFVLGDPLYWFDWVTGIASATIVAITLSRVSLDADPSFPRTPMRLLRGMIYVPVLLFEIVKANLTVARVILDPRLPIDPTMNRVRVLVGSGLPVMTLANSITLTPGTLTVRARDNELYVQSLIPSARNGLFDGSLERWARFVYYGRNAARLPTPRERDDVAILQGPDATEALPMARADGGVADGEAADAADTNETNDRASADEGAVESVESVESAGVTDE